jgi:FAD/FMN-containing dehydrogenase
MIGLSHEPLNWEEHARANMALVLASESSWIWSMAKATNLCGMRHIKELVDPKGLMNPDKIFF